jgi:glycosyltransferase involved in cell wall biosynthesis
MRRVPTAKFVGLTAQVSELTGLADRLAIPRDRRFVTSVGHDDIHRWLPWIDFGLLLLVEPNAAKRSSMPTKLGEFLATGVSPVAYGCNTEMTDWVRRAGSGFVLEDLSEGSLERAADFVAEGGPPEEIMENARRIAEAHFSLDSGAARYDALFQRVLRGGPPAVRARR